ncbi:calumenin-A-like [Paralichthys olivaceus]|uniref:calumenin-A-like n=1 Tax=Paralichthys olivaceus TaxID=8255 RepID=UPI003752CCB8
MIRLLLMCFVFCVVHGSSKQTETETPVIEEELVSPLEHDEDRDHDQEASVAQDGARSFNQLPPEESIRRLGIILDRIDINKDDFISVDELKIWIQTARRNYTNERVEKQWKDYDADEDGLISWDEFKNVSYGGYMDDPHIQEDFNYTHEMLRDERRFRAADTDGDLNANKHEFNAFLHPENYRHMRDVVIQETIEDFDKNEDGFIDLNEYIEELFSPENDEKVPDWVEKERQQFSELKDKNKDGKLDKQEMMELIFPPDFNFADAEVKHLLEQSDANKDGKLTKVEILDKHEMYVGSQVTNFGETLLRHDEF